MQRKLNHKFWLIVILMLPAQIAAAACSADWVQLKSDGNSAAFNVEVVDTDETRAKGLMLRKTLAKFSGMLFIYDKPARVSFWMRNTLIPLDMIFIDQTGTVAKVHANAVPLDETAIFGGDSIFAVLEINGGLAETLAITTGTVIQHPAFNPEIAAWPCKK